MLDAIEIATVPAVLAIVTLAKDAGMPKKLSPILAVLAGIGLTWMSCLAMGVTFNAVSLTDGIVLGLCASGVYDGARIFSSSSSSETERGKHHSN